jgi:hypothetical protein
LPYRLVFRDKNKKPPPVDGGFARDLRTESGFRLGLPETKATVALFPLTALLKQIDTLKTLQDVTPGRNLAGTSQTAMLTHFFFSCSKN